MPVFIPSFDNTNGDAETDGRKRCLVRLRVDRVINRLQVQP